MSASDLHERYPLTFTAFRDMQALPQLDAVAALDQRWQELEEGRSYPTLHASVPVLPPCDATWDLIYAGGGLGLLHALVMRQRYGYSVLVFDRERIGRAHREWNISAAELDALVQLGIFSPAELEGIIAWRHQQGVVRFFAGTIPVPSARLQMQGVLDVSLDAGALLQKVREKFIAVGGTIMDNTQLLHVLASPNGVAVEVKSDGGPAQYLGARLLLDGMGATSPLALQQHHGRPFAGVCPTVGTIVKGLERGTADDQFDPDTGDILVSVADAQDGHQLIWEGFAGRDEQLTIYLFYYDRTGQKRGGHSLLALFEQYFALLPTYKRPGPSFGHLRPVYGFIPSRHSQRRSTNLPLQRVLAIGDAAAQQSPLTFTGFGSHIRNLGRTTSLLDYALRHELLQPQALKHISAYQANVALHWVFSRFMQPWGHANDVNRLQNIFARVLNDLGEDVAVRFFKDQMRWRDYGRIVNRTLQIYPPIMSTAWSALGPYDAGRWIIDYLRFSGAACLASVGRRLNDRRWQRLEALVARLNPQWAFILKARRAEWHVMGWLGADTAMVQ